MADLNKQKDKYLKDLDLQVHKIEDALVSLKKSLQEIQVGDGKFAYWNGSNACSTIKTALTQYSSDLELLKVVAECKSKIKK